MPSIEFFDESSEGQLLSRRSPNEHPSLESPRRLRSRIIDEDHGKRTTLVGTDEDSADIDGDVTMCSMLSAIANCTNTILGSGTLAVPIVISSAGLVLYEIIIVGVFVATFISMRWLIAVADVVPQDKPRNYVTIATNYLGPGAASAISGAFMFGGFSLTVGYMLMITQALVPLVDKLCLLPEAQMSLVVLWGVGLVIVLPLSLLKDISRLKFTSALAILTLTYSAGYIVVTCCSQIATLGVHESVKAVRPGTSVFSSCAMTVSAFSCHLSAIPIYESLGPRRTPQDMMVVVMISISLSAAFYQGVGIVGYLRYGETVDGNILTTIARENENTISMILANIGMSLTLIFSLPIVMWPLRSCALALARAFIKSLTPHSDLDVSREESQAIATPSATEWNLTTCFLMVAILTIATLIPDIKAIMSVGGSVGGAFIVFIYPSSFLLAVVKKCKLYEFCSVDNLPQLAMIGIGVVAGILCLALSLMNFFTQKPIVSTTSTSHSCEGALT